MRTRQVRAGAEHPAPAHASRLLPGPTLPPLSWEDGRAGAGGACVHAAASPRQRASHHQTTDPTCSWASQPLCACQWYI